MIPQISLIMGPCAGGAVYSPAMTDFIFMVKETSHMFITGPEVIKTVTGEEVEFEELGGAMSHNSKSGVAHFAAEDEESCLEDVRYLMSFLPLNNLELPPRVEPYDDPDREDPELDTLVPDDPPKPYDMREVVAPHRRRRRVLRGPRALRQEHHLRLLAASTAIPVGVVGNQPAHLAGVLDIESSEKAARFVRTCDAFNVPLLTFTDVPGFLPGTSQEWGGIIRHGAKLLYAFTEATVPKLTVVTRKAYGGAYDVMNSKHMLADFNFAWPTAEVAVMGPEGAVNIIYRKDIAAVADARRAPREADRRLQGALRQPLLGGRARLHRRRDRAAPDPPEADQGAAHAADQAGRAAEAQARQHPALGRSASSKYPVRCAERGSKGEPELRGGQDEALFWVNVAAAAALAVAAAPATAATLTPNITAEDNGTADCSLREAIDAAVANSDGGGCDTETTGPYGNAMTDEIVLTGSPYNLTNPTTNEDLNFNGDLDVGGGGPIVIRSDTPGVRRNISMGSLVDRMIELVNVNGVADLTLRDIDLGTAGELPDRERGRDPAPSPTATTSTSRTSRSCTTTTSTRSTGA